MIGIDQRILYYLGNYGKWYGQKPEVIAGSGYDKPILLDINSYKMNFRTIHPNTMYPIDVGRYLSYSTRPIYIQCGDSTYSGSSPVLVKCKRAYDRTGSVIANLNSARHFVPIKEALESDCPWDEKISSIAWRGADTGGARRLNFVKNYYKKYNVGFNKYVQDSIGSRSSYKDDYIMGSMNKDDLLRYKYLPVVPGNDKASNLGWVMASGSVPIMPKPEYHSWVCEPWMQPGLHYVEVRPDFLDLDEKIEWCRKNDSQCKVIAENGKKFMLQFENKAVEEYIERKLVDIVGLYGTTRGVDVAGQGVSEQKKTI